MVQIVILYKMSIIQIISRYTFNEKNLIILTDFNNFELSFIQESWIRYGKRAGILHFSKELVAICILPSLIVGNNRIL